MNTPQAAKSSRHPLVGQRVVWRGLADGTISRAEDRAAGGPLVDVRLDGGDSVSGLTEGEWEALPNDSCGWFYRRYKWQPDHVIALCDGHAYLAGRGWKKGSGDMPNLPPADKCCVCIGTATIPRMRGAPLKPNDEMTSTPPNATKL